ncbi:MAG: cupredoxin domain-containing protein [Acidobacteria bacterium]|nr:cupredoxin domain-containing protein [Acidobacteriota bacterium]
MDTAEIIVTTSGIFVNALVVWFFLLSKRRAVRAEGQKGIQEITIQVKGGYNPDRIVVKKGVPVRLNFFREETDGCSERVLFEDFGINRELPAFQTTTITLAPEKAGEYTFTCGMHMLRGTLVVEE